MWSFAGWIFEMAVLWNFTISGFWHNIMSCLSGWGWWYIFVSTCGPTYFTVEEYCNSASNRINTTTFRGLWSLAQPDFSHMGYVIQPWWHLLCNTGNEPVWWLTVLESNILSGWDESFSLVLSFCRCGEENYVISSSYWVNLCCNILLMWNEWVTFLVHNSSDWYGEQFISLHWTSEIRWN